jgi:molybdopterin synthase catalytic subunit
VSVAIDSEEGGRRTGGDNDGADGRARGAKEVRGGDGSRRLTREEIDSSAVLSSVHGEGAGAVVLFLGTVRDSGKQGEVTGIDYEAYEPMAEKRLALAEASVRRRYPATIGVRIVHRLGTLLVGETSVAVAVSSPHRAEAFEACRYAIEVIKHDVPIWKRERLNGGKTAWVEGVPIGSATEDSDLRSATVIDRAPGPAPAKPLRKNPELREAGQSDG